MRAPSSNRGKDVSGTRSGTVHECWTPIPRGCQRGGRHSHSASEADRHERCARLSMRTFRQRGPACTVRRMPGRYGQTTSASAAFAIVMIVGAGSILALERLPRPPTNPNPVAVDLLAREPGKPWPASCLVHRTCGVVAQRLATCAPGTSSRPWTEIAARPDRLVGTTVSIRGPLVLGPLQIAGILCTEVDAKTGKPIPTCCPDQSTTAAQIFIGVSTARLGIPGHGCQGDASRLCCNVDSLGKVVVATGRL